jgi:hypothetical protein
MFSPVFNTSFIVVILLYSIVQFVHVVFEFISKNNQLAKFQNSHSTISPMFHHVHKFSVLHLYQCHMYLLDNNHLSIADIAQ